MSSAIHWPLLFTEHNDGGNMQMDETGAAALGQGSQQPDVGLLMAGLKQWVSVPNLEPEVVLDYREGADLAALSHVELECQSCRKS